MSLIDLTFDKSLYGLIDLTLDKSHQLYAQEERIVTE